MSSFKKILIVEDDDSIRDAMKELFELEGYQVEFGINGDDGINVLRLSSPPPNLILLDIMMPVKNGYQFRDEQLRDPKIADISVIIMSADGNVEAKREAMGVKAAIKKPFNIDSIMCLVAQNC